MTALAATPDAAAAQDIAAIQGAMLNALYAGPDAIPGGVFAGPSRRIALGMAVHANTVAHARMTALADSVPRLIAAIGRAEFDAVARPFIDEAATRSHPLAHIGERFADWLAANGQPRAHVELAHIDAAALACLHAADVAPLTLADLPQDEAALLSLHVAVHPAARLLRAAHALPLIEGITATGGDAPTDSLLVVRSGYTITLCRLDAEPLRMLDVARRGASGGASIGTLLADNPADGVATLITLITLECIAADPGALENAA